MTYELKYETPSVDDYIRIRLAAGLSKKSKEAAELGLPNSLCAVIVYSNHLPVGIGRVIGDGGCFFEIVDIAVDPEFYKRFGFQASLPPEKSGMSLRINR